MFSRFDRYVLREVTASWLGVTGVLFAILISNQLAQVLGLAASNGFPREVVFRLIALTAVQNVVLFVPIGLLLAVMLALGRLYHESEMTAMRACGVGPTRLYRPVFALAVPLAIALAWLTFDLGPAARTGAESLRSRAMRDAQFGRLEPGTFRTFAGGNAVFYAARTGPDGTLGDVFVQRQVDDRVEIAVAASAEQRMLEGGRAQLLILRDGERYEGVPGQAEFRRIRFAEHGIPIVIPEVGAGRDRRERRTTAELLESDDPGDVAELQRRASLPVMLLVLALLAVPLAALRPREGRYARVALAILIYLVYSNLLSAAQVWIQRGTLEPEIGVWWVHALAAAGGLWLLNRQSPLLRWPRPAGATQ